MKADVQHLTQKLADLQSEKANLQKQEADIQPAYERCLQNKEVKDRAIASRKQIDDMEKRLAEDHVELQHLSQVLDRESKLYEESITRTNRFLEQVKQHVRGLHTAVRDKIATSVSCPAAKTVQEVAHLSDVCSDIVEQREVDSVNVARYRREADASVQLKSAMLDSLQSSTAAQLSERKKLKDEFIKDAVYRMQDERNSLQADIEEVRKVNDEQATNLLKGHHMDAIDAEAFQRQEMARKAAQRRAITSSRQTKLIEGPPAICPEEEQIRTKNAELEKEIQHAAAALSLEMRNKTELSKSHRAMLEKVKRDAERFASTLQELEAQVVAQVQATKSLERENGRLVDKVDHLTAALQFTKSHIERIRGHARPLPIEA